MSAVRYIYRTVPVAPNDAQRARDALIEATQNEIKHRRRQIAECENYLTHLQAEPLPTTREEQITLSPSDPRYYEALPIFNPAEYQGDMVWM